MQHRGELVIRLGGDLRVTLTCANGKQPERLDVELTDARGAVWYVDTTSPMIERDSLPPGEYMLRVQAQDCGPFETKLIIRASEQTQLDTSLASGGSVGFVLLGHDEGPLGVEATLTVTTVDGQLLFADVLEPRWRGAVGRWLFAPHGELEVAAETSDGRRAEMRFTFNPTDGSQTPHVLVLN